METPAPGTIGWFDLTVPDAPKLRDFYRDVVGWSSSEVVMGDYADFCMHPGSWGAPPVAASATRGVTTPTCRRSG